MASRDDLQRELLGAYGAASLHLNRAVEHVAHVEDPAAKRTLDSALDVLVEIEATLLLLLYAEGWLGFGSELHVVLSKPQIERLRLRGIDIPEPRCPEPTAR